MKFQGKTQPELGFDEGYGDDPDMLAAVQESKRQNIRPRHGQSSRMAAEQAYDPGIQRPIVNSLCHH